MSRGLFVAFEGGEGAGKSTQVELLAHRLRDAGCSVVVTREPGGTEVAESIREFLLDPRNGGLTARAEALMFAAARAEHVNQLIAPALERGDTVICDRFVDSSVAYQGVGRGLGAQAIRDINSWATADTSPDITFVMDIDPRVGLARARDVSDPDRMESLDLSFHDTVRDAFIVLARQDAHVLLDATADTATLTESVWATVWPHVETRKLS